MPPRGLLYSPVAMVVSPDGGNLYVTSGLGPDAGAVTTFDRDELTGAIEEVGCVSADGTGGRCAVDPAVLNPSSIAVSPDRSNVYAGVGGNIFFHRGRGLVVFARNRANGALTATTCLNDDGSNGCAKEPLAAGGAVVVSPDGRQVYAGTVVFARDPEDGTLTRTTCANPADPTPGCTPPPSPTPGPGGVAISPDGRSAYAGTGSFYPVTMARDPMTGALVDVPCTAGPAFCDKTFGGPLPLTVSADGRTVYGTGIGTMDNFMTGRGGNLFAFRRDTRTGSLASMVCFGPDLPVAACTPSAEVHDPVGVAVPVDGRGLFVVSGGSWADVGRLAVFARDPVTGGLLEGGCFGQGASGSGAPGACAGARAIGAARSVATSPDGRNVYVGAASERIAVFGPAVAIQQARLDVSRRGLGRTLLACPRVVGSRCHGTLSLRTSRPVAVPTGRRQRRHRIVLAATTFAILAGRTSAVRVQLTAPGQRLLRRGRSLAATATVRGAGNVSGLTILPVTVRLERR